MNDEVRFPLEGLDVRPFCANMDELQESDRLPLAETRYDLIAVVTHFGSFYGTLLYMYNENIFL